MLAASGRRLTFLDFVVLCFDLLFYADRLQSVLLRVLVCNALRGLEWSSAMLCQKLGGRVLFVLVLLVLPDRLQRQHRRGWLSTRSCWHRAFSEDDSRR